VREANLLGSDDGHAAAAVTTADLLGSTGTSDSAGMDPLAPAGSAAAGGSMLGGLTTLDMAPTSGATLSSQTATASMPLASSTGPMGAMGAMSGPSAFAMSGSDTAKDKDAFDFVGAELCKASTKP